MYFKILLSFILSFYTQNSFASFIEVDKESPFSHQVVVPFQTNHPDEPSAHQNKRTLQIINIPSEANVLKLENDKNLELSFLKLSNDILNGNDTHGLRALTLDEAKKSFTPLLCKTSGVPQTNIENSWIYKQVFDEKNFGFLDSDAVSDNLTVYRQNYPFSASINTILASQPGTDQKFNAFKSKLPLSFLLSSSNDLALAYMDYRKGWGPLKIGEKSVTDEEYLNHIKGFFVPENIGLPETEPEIEKHFKTHSLGFFDHTLIKNIYNTAQKIIETTKPQDTIVLFGNTPYFVGRALKLILDQENSNRKRSIIHFPFSGSPNSVRPGSVLNSANIVTQERLTHLQARMKKVGLWPGQQLLNNNVWFVDVYGSGSGVAYFCEELLRNYQLENKDFPELRFISLNKIDINNALDRRNSSISENSALDGQSTVFNFPSLKKPHFKMTGQVVFLPQHTLLDMLPSEDWRAIPEYQAFKWNAEYDAILTQTPPVYLQRLFQYFDMHIKDLINSSMS